MHEHAGRLMKSSSSRAGLIQRCSGSPCRPAPCPDRNERLLLRSRFAVSQQRADAYGFGESPAPVTAERSLAGHGRRLEPPVRKEMEQRFGHDFGRVRVHDDVLAAQGAEAVGARAYTVGSDIFFAAGRYQPRQPEGRRLLAHELAHTVQQFGAVVGSQHLVVGSNESVHERNADQAAESALTSRRPSQMTSTTRPLVQRQTAPVLATRNPATLPNRDLIVEYRRLLAASDPAAEGYFLAVEAELTRRVQVALRRQAIRTGRAVPPGVSPAAVSEASMGGPLAIALAMRLLLSPVATGGAVTTTTVTTVAGAGGASAVAGAGAAAPELAAAAPELAVAAETGTAATAGETVLAAAETGVGVSFAAVAAVLAVLFYPSSIAPEPPMAPREPQDEEKVQVCQRLQPSAIPIHWPIPIWHFLGGIDDPGATRMENDLPEEPIVIKAGSTYYDPSRPEIGMYRTRMTNPPFNKTIPAGWPIHHKWPLFLGGAQGPQAVGEYDAVGNVIAAPNLVVLAPAAHTTWHQSLAQQPFGPRPGMGPSERTTDGTSFCVLELI